MNIKGLQGGFRPLSEGAGNVPNEYSRPGDIREPGRALIRVQPVSCPSYSPDLRGRPSAPFLAHLIATENAEPQTREYRRANAADAHEIYAAALKLGRLM